MLHYKNKNCKNSFENFLHKTIDDRNSASSLFKHKIMSRINTYYTLNNVQHTPNYTPINIYSPQKK